MDGQRGREEKERDRALISELVLKGWSDRQIAEELSRRFYPDEGISPRTVGNERKVLHRRWVKEQLLNVSEAKARELARLDSVEREAWLAWNDSKPTVKTDGDEAEPPALLKRNNGDPNYLKQINWCIETRLRVLGADGASGPLPDGVGVLFNLSDIVAALRSKKKESKEEGGQSG